MTYDPESLVLAWCWQHLGAPTDRTSRGHSMASDPLPSSPDRGDLKGASWTFASVPTPLFNR